jgi:MFS family permease
MRELKKIYAMSFLSGLSNAATVTFTLYFLSHGLSQGQIGFLFGFFMICMAIFNIPTGGIADMFGHKKSVVIGLFLQAVSFLLFFLYPTYIGFLVGMFFSALGIAFQTGATSSLIYELLHKENLHEDFQKVIGRVGGYSLVAAMIASPLGTIIYKFYPSIPYLLSFFFFVLAAFAIYLVKWEFIKKSPTFSKYIAILTSGIHLTLRNRILMATVLIGIALSVNRLVFNQNISQPYQISIGIDVAYIGFVAALVAAIQAFISVNAYKISKRVGKSFSLLLIVAVPSIAVIALSFINTLLALPFILFLYMGHGFRDPVLAHISQEEVEPDKRSTMASTTSFLMSISVGILLPFWGKGIDLFGIHNSLFLLGTFSFIVGAIGLVMFETKRKI